MFPGSSNSSSVDLGPYVVSPTKTDVSPNCNAGPDELDHAERPCARQEAVSAGKEASGRECEHKRRMPTLKCVHRHHEGDCDYSKEGDDQTTQGRLKNDIGDLLAISGFLTPAPPGQGRNAVV